MPPCSAFVPGWTVMSLSSMKKLLVENSSSFSTIKLAFYPSARVFNVTFGSQARLSFHGTRTPHTWCAPLYSIILKWLAERSTKGVAGQLTLFLFTGFQTFSMILSINLNSKWTKLCDCIQQWRRHSWNYKIVFIELFSNQTLFSVHHFVPFSIQSFSRTG